MKKIMFNDKYGLTKAVLYGKKTQTRRIIQLDRIDLYSISETSDWFSVQKKVINGYSRYKVGETVAIAQCYYDIVTELRSLEKKIGKDLEVSERYISRFYDKASYTNKMFVAADKMLHYIKITNIHIERLQSISQEDCIKEGVRREKFGDSIKYYCEGIQKKFFSATDAFSFLIDKLSGKGTWNENPWFFVYDFELVK